MEIDWAAWIVPCISGALGVGVTWGTIRQKVESNTDRITKMETKLEKQVGEDHCKEMRVDCQTRIDKGFNKIEAQLSNVANELKTIAVWMAKHNGD